MTDDLEIQWLINPGCGELLIQVISQSTDSGCVMLLLQKAQDKYVEDGKEHGPNHEQKQWEEDHLNAALLKFGAKDSKERRKVTTSQDISLTAQFLSPVPWQWFFPK